MINHKEEEEIYDKYSQKLFSMSDTFIGRCAYKKMLQVM